MIMGITEILDLIQSLAQSQGMYGRLYQQLMEIKESDDETWEQVVDMLEGQEFTCELDFILWYECGTEC